MSELARRRMELVERLDRERDALAEAFGTLKGRMKIAETLVGAVQRANRHRALTGTLALMAIVAPFAARTWFKRAAWLLPLVIQGIRLVRSTRDRRSEPTE